MEKKQLAYFIIILFSLLASNWIYAQSSGIIRSGLIRAQATISPSFMFSDGRSYFYLHGNAEGFLTDKISLAAEGYYYLGSQSAISSYQYNHSGFFGAVRHFTKGNSDFSIGIQPGISMTKLNAVAFKLKEARTGVNPVFAVVGGYNYFVNHIFHFFVQARIIAGEHHYDVHQGLNEFRLSAGLGFNVNAKRWNKL